MQYLEIVACVPNRVNTEVYPILCDFESYPENSKAVRSVSIDALPDGQTMSVWEVNFRDGVLRWTEKDFFNPLDGTINFELIEGDIAHFSGQWKVQPQDKGCRICFSANLDMGIPSLNHILEPIAEQTLSENIMGIIKGLFGEQVEFYTSKLIPS